LGVVFGEGTEQATAELLHFFDNGHVVGGGIGLTGLAGLGGFGLGGRFGAGFGGGFGGFKCEFFAVEGGGIDVYMNADGFEAEIKIAGGNGAGIGFVEDGFARGGGVGLGQGGQAQALIQALAGDFLDAGLVFLFPALKDFELVIVEEGDVQPLVQFGADVLEGFIGGEHVAPEGLVILGHGVPEIDEVVMLAGLAGGRERLSRRRGGGRGRRAGRERRGRGAVRGGGGYS